MKEVCMEHKVTGNCVTYNNVVAYDTHGADDDGPVFYLILSDGNTATFHKAEWHCFVREWVEHE